MADDLWVIGDVQGHLEAFRRVLRETALVADDDRWIGGTAALVVVGDLVDRGPDGIGVVELLMSLQRQGDVRVLVGNHDMFLLAARRFPNLLADFQRVGGQLSDLHRLTEQHVEWLRKLPAMLVYAGTLFVHADAMLYLNYGQTVEAVNDTFRTILSEGHLDLWSRLLDEFSEHRAFLSAEKFGTFVATYGADVVVHGHTPIARMLRVPPESVTQAYQYQGGRCVNVDPGLYLGGPGFAHHLRVANRTMAQ